MNALAPELRLLHVLLHAGADADAAPVGRVLSRSSRCRRGSQAVAQFLPLKHAIDLARPLMLGRVPEHVAAARRRAAVLCRARATTSALVLTRRRLLASKAEATRMLVVKSLHIIFMVAWFAGLFYLPRLFVYHAQATDAIGIERFKVMERRLYCGIMTPSAVLTVVFGAVAVAGLRHHRRLAAREARAGRAPDRASTSGSASWCATSPPTATRTATCSIAGSTRFPRCRSSCCVVFLVVMKPF